MAAPWGSRHLSQGVPWQPERPNSSPPVSSAPSRSAPVRASVAPYRGGTAEPHPEDGRGESALGTTPHPGRARAAGLQGVGADCRQVRPPALRRDPFNQLAGVLVEDDEVIETLPAHGPDKAFHVAILPRRPRGLIT